MKYLTLLLVVVALAATVSKVTAQDPPGNSDAAGGAAESTGNSNSNGNENNTSSTNTNTDDDDGDEDDDDDNDADVLDDNEGGDNSTNDGDDGTPGDDNAANSTDSSNSTDTTSGENPFESAVIMDTPMVEESCAKVFAGCNDEAEPEPTMCSTWEEEMGPCLEGDLEADNTTYSCTSDEVKKFKTYCVGSVLLRYATNQMVGVNCQKRIADIAQTKEFEGLVSGQDKGFCAFIDDNESDFVKASESDATAKCTDAEYSSFHEGVCDSCSTIVASLSLVVAMVTAQLIFSRD